jgi:two-component system cell cycle response regulator
MGKPNQDPATNGASPRDAAHHVLLIGEDPKQTELLAELIREVADCHVDVVSRIESSFDWVGRSSYHLVVIDASAPAAGERGAETRPDGLGLLERVRRLSPLTSVILISEQATVEEAVAAVRLGAEDYLRRPFNPESLQLAVKRGLDRKAVFAEGTSASSYLNLLTACQMVSATLEETKVFGVVRSYVSREVQSDHAAVYRLQDGELRQVAEPEGDRPRDRAMEEILGIALAAANPVPSMLETGAFFRFVERGHVTPGLFLFRFRCVGDADHFVVCLSPERPVAADLFESRLRMLRAQIEVTGRNIAHYLGVQHLVYVDDATGLYNTRYMNYLLDREIAQSQATGRSFAILFIDADKFKGINDAHGHLVGTKLLNELGAMLKTLTRDTDTVFRYGGDEFVAVLSPCDLATAQAVAERIRRAVDGHVFIESEGLNVRFTVSIGVALFPDHATTKKQVIEAADHAMYAAKRKTRNTVFIADLRGEGAAPAAHEAGAAPDSAAPVKPTTAGG